VHFIIALRDDYFSVLAEFQEAIPDLFTHEMRVARFTHAQALAAAVEPVKRVGWSIDEALVAEVILPQLDEVEKGIEPPLLQIVCDALYQQAQDAGRTSIGAEEYAALGDVRQALVRYLDATLRQFGQQQPQARAVLKALVTTEGTKRASFVDEIVARLHSTGLALTEEAVERDFLRKLVQARLVRVEDIEGRPRYELAHEFLVQQIGTWIADSERELTKVLELIDRAYEAYRATGLLLEAEALALIAPFQDELVVPAEKQRFLDLSRQTARRRRRGLWMKVGALLLLVGLGVGGFFGVQVYRSNQQLQASNQQLAVEKAEANTQRQMATAREQQAQQRLAALYIEQGRQELLQGNPSKAVVYLSEAYQSRATGPVLRMLLADAMRSIDVQLTSLEGHTGGVWSARFSPDGTRVLTASWDRTAKLWEGSTGRLLASLEGHTGKVWSAQFSPDGTRVLTTSEDQTAKLWEGASGRLLASLEDHTSWVTSAQFSPDGTRVLTTSGDKTVKLWDVHLETRSPAEIAALVRCRALWRLDEGRLVPTPPDTTACPPRSPAR
jgi:conflict system STAND superfamily ATPase/WD40 domain-containing protein